MTLIIGLLTVAATILVISLLVMGFLVWAIYMGRCLDWIEWKITGR